MASSRLVSIDFACNEPDNGLFNGRAGSAMYGDIELEAPAWEGFAFKALPDAIRLHRKTFPIHSSNEWVGSWCWNRYWLAREDMKRLLRTLRAKGWRCTCGPHHFYRWFNGNG